MNSILITGCNRGLGLGLVKSLVKIQNPPKFIFATCRDLNKADVSKFNSPLLIGAIAIEIKQTTQNLRTRIS